MVLNVPEDQINDLLLSYKRVLKTWFWFWRDECDFTAVTAGRGLAESHRCPVELGSERGHGAVSGRVLSLTFPSLPLPFVVASEVFLMASKCLMVALALPLFVLSSRILEMIVSARSVPEEEFFNLFT